MAKIAWWEEEEWVHSKKQDDVKLVINTGLYLNANAHNPTI